MLMRELPVDAKAICQDGDAGHVTDVIVDPVARTVTHIVISESTLGGREFLVPLDKVIDSSITEVHLAFTRAELAHFPEFTTTRFVSASSPEAQPVIAARQMEMWTTTYGYEPMYLPYVEGTDEPVPIVEPRIPAGEVDFARGAHVQSSDGEYVGDVEAFVIRPEDASITHVVVRSGSMTAAREVTLPVSAVKSGGDSLMLTMTREQVERLPSVPAGGKFRPVEGQPGAKRLISIVFDAPKGADEALSKVKAEVKDGHVEHVDAAVIRKSEDGKVHVAETADMSTGRGAATGAVVGGVLSVLAGPVGLVGAAAAGAATGGLTAHLVDRGVPDRYARDLGRALRANSSAIVLLAEQRFEATLLEALAPLGGEVLRLALSDEMLARLIAK